MVHTSERSSGNDSVAAAPRAERSEPNIDILKDLKSFDSVVNNRGSGTQVASLDANAGFPNHADYSFYNSNAFGTAVGDSSAKGANGFGISGDSSARGANGLGDDSTRGGNGAGDNSARGTNGDNSARGTNGDNSTRGTNGDNSARGANGIGDNSTRGANGTAAGTDSGVNGTATGDNPNGQFAAPNYYNDYKQDASKFAFGTALTDSQSAEGREKLQRLTEEVYRLGGKDGLKTFAGDMSKDAENKFGESAFDQAGPAFDNSLAKVKVTPNADGSTQVQWNFAQPNSPDSKGVIFQIPKAQPSTGGYQEVFPDNKPTWKF